MWTQSYPTIPFLLMSDHRHDRDLLAVKEAAVTMNRDAMPEPLIAQADFGQAIRPNIQLIERALQGKLAIPDNST